MSFASTILCSRGSMPGWLLLVVVAHCVLAAASPTRAQPPADPLAPILEPEVRSSVELVLETYREGRKYTDDQFPLPPERFTEFRREVVDRMTASLGLEDWAVRGKLAKKSPLEGKFRDRLLKTVEHHGVAMEVHLIEIPATGDRVPAVVCLPPGDGVRPGVCCFSGHTRHGLKDLVVDLDSYQQGVAVRLARAGFATIAVEKIDTGYLARNFGRGVDENPIVTFRLAWGRTTRAHQLMACLAAAEILAAHPRVDETRIGATGVSLGGWLSIQTALLSDRIAAVADFGRKTVHVPPDMTPEKFNGVTDMCHIMPGLLSLCDRNLMALAYAPRPLLAGHGRRDTGSHQEGPVHFERIFRKQYAALGASDAFRYHVHAGGDTMPAEAVIDYFRARFQPGE